MMLQNTYPHDLHLNFLPIQVNNRSTTAYVSNYTTKSEYEKIKQNYSKCSFFRQGSNIFCIPLTNDAETKGIKESIDFNSNVGLKLIRETLSKQFISDNTKILKLSPFRFINIERDLITQTSFSSKLSGMHIFPRFELTTKSVRLSEESKDIGVLIDVALHYEISWTIKELIDMGIDVSNMYIIEKLTDRNQSTVVNYTKTVGKIKEISNERAILTDFREQSTIDTSRCYPDPNKENFKKIIQFILGAEYDRFSNEIEKIEHETIGAEGKFNEIEQMKSQLKNLGNIQICHDNYITVSEEYVNESNSKRLEFRQLENPRYIFDPGREKTGSKHDEGINEFGPFDSGAFDRREPRILVIVPAVHKGEVEIFMKKFFEGIPESKRFAKGFLRKYNLSKISKLDFITLEGDGASHADTYREACLGALRKMHQIKEQYDLAFVIIQESFHSLFGNQNPYLVAKSILMSEGIPVQEIKIENIHKTKAWQYIMNNMGLACYAKLGGIPFTIATARPISHELIIGLGSTIVRTGRFDANPRYVGITTVFSAEGNYLLYTLSKEAEYEKYFSELKKSIEEVIKESEKRLSWQKGDTIRLIFHHQFKRFKNEEVNAIRELVSSFTDYNFEYAFVNIHTGHSFNLFDKKKNGFVSKFEQNYKYYGMTRGKYIPDRGFMLKINLHEALISITGPFQLKTPLQGCPKPLLVSLHRDSNFKDIEYLAKQAYQFTFLSWRSFFPSTTPVTILYSNEIAKLLGMLRGVENWNPYILATKLRLSRWFL